MEIGARILISKTRAVAIKPQLAVIHKTFPASPEAGQRFSPPAHARIDLVGALEVNLATGACTCGRESRPLPDRPCLAALAHALESVAPGECTHKKYGAAHAE